MVENIENKNHAGMNMNEDIEKKKVRKAHPLGKKIKIKAYSLNAADKKSQIFASINQFTYEFQQNTIVEVPEEIVKFLENATRIVPTVDEKGQSKSVTEPLYAVSRL